MAKDGVAAWPQIRMVDTDGERWRKVTKLLASIAPRRSPVRVRLAPQRKGPLSGSFCSLAWRRKAAKPRRGQVLVKYPRKHSSHRGGSQQDSVSTCWSRWAVARL